MFKNIIQHTQQQSFRIEKTSPLKKFSNSPQKKKTKNTIIFIKIDKFEKLYSNKIENVIGFQNANNQQNNTKKKTPSKEYFIPILKLEKRVNF